MSSNGFLVALVGLAAATAACLPAGDPPAGRQVLIGRDMVIVGVLPVRSGDSTLRFLIARAGDEGTTVSLASLADGDAAASERVVVEKWSGGACAGLICLALDGNGRIYVHSFFTDEQGVQKLTRFDPITGDRLDLGPANLLELSPSRQRIAFVRYGPVVDLALLEADDSTTVLPAGSIGMFIGEDYFFQLTGDPALTLWRVAPWASPEVVRTNVLNFSPVYPPEGPLLMTVALGGDDWKEGPISFLDLTTYEERLPPIAAGRLLSLSPDARWAVLRSPDLISDRELALLELATGVEEPFVLPWAWDDLQWRPGHAEIWVQPMAGQQEAATSMIKRPQQPLVGTPVPAGTFQPGGPGSIFTRDGSHWFSRQPGQTNLWSVFVGDADDLAAPRFPLNADGTDITGYREMRDGRLLIQATYASYLRNDITVIDPTDGSTRLLGKDGRLLAYGARRVVASLRYVNESGDLTVIDVDSGASTVLATEFAQGAVVEPPGSGLAPVEPGARVVFHFRARFDSPYDGIWVATLP